jgi:carbon-monoxide dehydrogenase large subunit
VTAATRSGSRFVGRPILRLEDRALVTGAGEYAADFRRSGQVWARIVRSEVAHGAIVNVDLDAVRDMPGVIAAYAAADALELATARIPPRLEAAEESPIPDWGLQPIIASERVRYVGEPVAVIVATDPYLAETAAERVWVEIEEEDAVLDALDALEGEVLLHPERGTNVNVEMRFAGGAELDALFAEAEVVISERFYEHRHGSTPLETRGFLAEVGEDGRLTVWGAAKVKHFNLGAVARVLGLPPEQLRFVEPDVGGAFGARGELYPEDYIIPWLALKLKRPVKWIEDRGESLVALNQSREHYIDVELAATADGRLLGFRSRNVTSLGAYMRTNGIVPPMLCAQSMHGPYAWRGFEARAVGVLTNKTPLGTFRGPGEVEATFARERMLDILASRIGIDPVELRRRNLIAPEAIPHIVRFGPEADDALRFGSGNYPEQLEALLAHVNYPALRESSADPDSAIGVGIACSVSESGVGHSEWARVVAEADGSFTAYMGIAAVGQGIRTALTQVAADQLEVSMDRVRVSHKDTDEVAEGEGAFGDRGMIFGVGALLAAIEDLRRNGGSEGVGRFKPGGPTWLSFCAAVAVVAVNLQTGKVTPLRYIGCYDPGVAVNPLLLEGQYSGAAAQGIGGALLEHSAYDSSGQPLATTFMDYLLPTITELPEIESLIVPYPEPTTPLGIKGGGNSGIICTHAAVANAVSDALRHYGVEVTSMPLRADRVRALIRAAEAAP